MTLKPGPKMGLGFLNILEYIYEKSNYSDFHDRNDIECSSTA